jgi:hypothetical protein
MRASKLLAVVSLATNVAHAQGLGAPAPVPGSDWKVQQTASTTPGSSTVVLTVQPTRPVLVGRDSVQPTIVLRCRDGAFAAYLAAGAMVETTPDASTYIRLRWDHDSAGLVQRWPGSASRQSVFAPAPVRFVESLIKSDSLRLTFVPEEQPAVEVAYNVRGLAPSAVMLAHGCPGAGLASVVPNVPESSRTVSAHDSVISPVTWHHWQEPRPDYPDAMLHIQSNGRVVLQFVLDTTGVPEPGTISAVSYTEPAYAAFAVNMMRQGRFTPATIGGHRVRVVAVDTFQLTRLLGCMPSERVTCFEFRNNETLKVSRAP